MLLLKDKKQGFHQSVIVTESLETFDFKLFAAYLFIFAWHQDNCLNVPWVDKNDVMRTHWFLGGGLFFLETDSDIRFFENLTPLF